MECWLSLQYAVTKDSDAEAAAFRRMNIFEVVSFDKLILIISLSPNVNQGIYSLARCYASCREQLLGVAKRLLFFELEVSSLLIEF